MCVTSVGAAEAILPVVRLPAVMRDRDYGHLGVGDQIIDVTRKSPEIDPPSVVFPD